MKHVNKIFLIGHLGANPVLRHTQDGTPVAHFSVATTRKFRTRQDAEGEATGEETQWHRIVAWGKLGEICARNLSKGRLIHVEGSVRSHQYEGKDKVRRLSFEVYAEQVGFLDSRPADRSEPAGSLGQPVEVTGPGDVDYAPATPVGVPQDMAVTPAAAESA